MPENTFRITNRFNADEFARQNKTGEMRFALRLMGPGNAVPAINPFFDADFVYDKSSPLTQNES